MDNQQPTPVIWLGSTKKAVQDFPLTVRQAVGFALFQAQLGSKAIRQQTDKKQRWTYNQNYLT